MSEVRVGQWSGAENRKHKRVPLRVPIECRSKERVLLAKAENISISGLLVRCSHQFPRYSEISVAFTLPGSTLLIKCTAQVAHTVPGLFMGLEMTGLDADARQQIDQYVASEEPVFKPK